MCAFARSLAIVIIVFQCAGAGRWKFSRCWSRSKIMPPKVGHSDNVDVVKRTLEIAFAICAKFSPPPGAKTIGAAAIGISKDLMNCPAVNFSTPCFISLHGNLYFAHNTTTNCVRSVECGCFLIVVAVFVVATLDLGRFGTSETFPCCPMTSFSDRSLFDVYK